jgi:hypothetical protein
MGDALVVDRIFCSRILLQGGVFTVRPLNSIRFFT